MTAADVPASGPQCMVHSCSAIGPIAIGSMIDPRSSNEEEKSRWSNTSELGKKGFGKPLLGAGCSDSYEQTP